MSLPAPWSAQFTLKIAEHCAGHPGDDRWLQLLGRDGDPACARQVAQILAAGDPAGAAAAECREACALLEFRQTLLTALSQENP